MNRSGIFVEKKSLKDVELIRRFRRFSQIAEPNEPHFPDSENPCKSVKSADEKRAQAAGKEFVIARPRSSRRRGDRSPGRRIFNQEKKKAGNEDVTRITHWHELELGPLSTRIKRMERIWPQNLASLRVVRGQRKFSVTDSAARPHNKDTKVAEATCLASQTLSFSETPLLRLKLARLPTRSALPIAPSPSISEILFLRSCFPY